MLKQEVLICAANTFLKGMQLYVWQNHVVVYTVHDRVAKN